MRLRTMLTVKTVLTYWTWLQTGSKVQRRVILTFLHIHCTDVYGGDYSHAICTHLAMMLMMMRRKTEMQRSQTPVVDAL